MTVLDYVVVGCLVAQVPNALWYGHTSWKEGAKYERARHMRLVIAVSRWRDGWARPREVLEEFERLEAQEMDGRRKAARR